MLSHNTLFFLSLCLFLGRQYNPWISIEPSIVLVSFLVWGDLSRHECPEFSNRGFCLWLIHGCLGGLSACESLLIYLEPLESMDIHRTNNHFSIIFGVWWDLSRHECPEFLDRQFSLMVGFMAVWGAVGVLVGSNILHPSYWALHRGRPHNPWISMSFWGLGRSVATRVSRISRPAIFAYGCVHGCLGGLSACW